MHSIVFKDKTMLLRELSKEDLIEIVLDLSKENKKLTNKVSILKDKLSLNSKNSSKSPSTDMNKPAPKSSRRKSNKNRGGQEGHIGTTLEQSKNPDEIKIHDVGICKNCECSLDGIAPTEVTLRQVVDIIPAKIKITEHRGHIKVCPCCDHVNQATFPNGIDKPIQYGESLKAKSLYFHQRQLIPYVRVQEIFRDEYGINISTGTLVNFNQKAYENASYPSSVIKQKIIASEVAHFDETGTQINGKLNWMHTASTETLTHFDVHPKRGLKGMKSAGIFLKFTGTAAHDHWKPYFNNENCDHALCNAHHLRELTFAEERYNQAWAVDMKSFLTGVNDKVISHKASGLTRFNKKTIDKLEARYDGILRRGVKELPKIDVSSDKLRKGEPKKHKVANLHNRLVNYKAETLAFMRDFSIPFTNNLPERDQRMEKVKQKISGGHRSRQGAKASARIRGYLSTALKNGIGAMDALTGLFAGRPFIPA